MRSVGYCLAGAAVLLLTMDFVTTGHSAAVIATVLAPKQDILVDRQLKGDKVAAAVRRQNQQPAEASRSIATVEVVGLEQAAIVYRDRDGRVLYRTDPVENATVVVRGVTLPQVTIRQAPQKPITPVVLTPPQPSTPAKPEEASKPRQKLPDGCEAAASPLSASGNSLVRARCFTELGPRTKVALLD